MVGEEEVSKVTEELWGAEFTLQEWVQLGGAGWLSSATVAFRRRPTPWGIETLLGIPKLITGAVLGCSTIRLEELVAVPLAVVTEIGPSTASVGTVAVRVVSLRIVQAAAWTEPKRTTVVPAKEVPVMVTMSPGAAVVGVNVVRVGGSWAGAVTVNVEARFKMPAPDKVTSIVAPPVQVSKILVTMGTLV